MVFVEEEEEEEEREERERKQWGGWHTLDASFHATALDLTTLPISLARFVVFA